MMLKLSFEFFKLRYSVTHFIAEPVLRYFGFYKLSYPISLDRLACKIIGEPDGPKLFSGVPLFFCKKKKIVKKNR